MNTTIDYIYLKYVCQDFSLIIIHKIVNNKFPVLWIILLNNLLTFDIIKEDVNKMFKTKIVNKLYTICGYIVYNLYNNHHISSIFRILFKFLSTRLLNLYCGQQ